MRFAMDRRATELARIVCNATVSCKVGANVILACHASLLTVFVGGACSLAALSAVLCDEEAEAALRDCCIPRYRCQHSCTARLRCTYSWATGFGDTTDGSH